eukprot:scaffold5519_cov166-Amphora_coffeaeformis.AAC.9
MMVFLARLFDIVKPPQCLCRLWVLRKCLYRMRLHVLVKQPPLDLVNVCRRQVDLCIGSFGDRLCQFGQGYQYEFFRPRHALMFDAIPLFFSDEVASQIRRHGARMQGYDGIRFPRRRGSSL